MKISHVSKVKIKIKGKPDLELTLEELKELRSYIDRMLVVYGPR